MSDSFINQTLAATNPSNSRDRRKEDRVGVALPSCSASSVVSLIFLSEGLMDTETSSFSAAGQE